MLLATGVEHNNLIIKLSAQNPFPVRDQDGEVVSTNKLSVGDVQSPIIMMKWKNISLQETHQKSPNSP